MVGADCCQGRGGGVEENDKRVVAREEHDDKASKNDIPPTYDSVQTIFGSRLRSGADWVWVWGCVAEDCEVGRE